MLKSKLYWKVRRIDQLNPPIVKAMYRLYESYYAHTSFEVFVADLKRKAEVILLFDRQKGQLQGFSTLVTLQLKQGDRSVPCVFSGDTIVHEKFWGQRSLGIAFLLYMFKKKMMKPWKPLYWFLISKGYKTYLLMANNFQEHYPRYEVETPAGMQDLIREASDRLFPGSYQDNGTLVFPDDKAARLKVGVADIDVDLLKHPRIQFFHERNPGWKEGEELACIAAMSLKMPFHYYQKSMGKLWNTPHNKGSRKLSRKPIKATVR